MSEHFKRLQYLLPERAESGRSAFDTSVKAMREWITHLPLANPALTAQRLIGALREMNATRIDPHRRLDALEVMRRPIHEAVEGLGKQIQGETFPMSAQRVQASDTVQDFERELVIGYIGVICDLCGPNGAVPFLRGRIAALALTRAIQHQSARLWNAYQTHGSPAVGVWQCLHDLFRFAVETHCDDKAETDSLTGNARMSPRSAYMQALLHAFAKPYHFIQKENSELHDALPVLASLCTIRPGYAPEGAIAVCTEGDHSPPVPPRGRQAAMESLWQMDVSPLLHAFEAALTLRSAVSHNLTIKSPSFGSVELSSSLVERLIKIWSGRKERAFPRASERVVVDTIIGLQSTHFVLSGNLDFDTFVRNARGTEDSNGESGSAIWAAQQQNQARYTRAQTIDRGIGGFRLRWDGGDDVRARVGELVAMAPTHGETHEWTVGMLRWLRVDALGAVEAGVETVAQDARAISVRSFDARGLARAPMRGLLVVPSKTDDTGAVEPYIIVPHLFDRDAIAVEVTHVDASAPQASIRVETISDMRIRHTGSLYLQIVLPPHMTDEVDASNAANDDASAKFVQFPQRGG